MSFLPFGDLLILSIWLFVMYFLKCKIDSYFEEKKLKKITPKRNSIDPRRLS
tara:strand:+ start:2860 stop:3015 length:156 start_codon:yes stop_codon:yes gene_type:complete